MSWLLRLARNPWWPPPACMVMIFWFSAQPHLPRVPDELLDLLLKKGAHAMEYAILAGLLWRAVAQTWPELRRERWANCLIWVVTIIYAVSDEFHQKFVPGRTPNVRDVLIDALGAALVLTLCIRYAGSARNFRLEGISGNDLGLKNGIQNRPESKGY